MCDLRRCRVRQSTTRNCAISSRSRKPWAFPTICSPGSSRAPPAQAKPFMRALIHEPQRTARSINRLKGVIRIQLARFAQDSYFCEPALQKGARGGPDRGTDRRWFR